jgi:hypothetical protein
MRAAILAVLAGTVLLAAGCGPAKPLTESEFKGFCYQYGEGKNGSCDTISVCNPYTVVLNTKQESLAACLAECRSIHGTQFWQYIGSDCAGPSDAANDWCQRYCRSAYPK